jgi:hypothetical protein
MYIRVHNHIIYWYKINYKSVTMTEPNPICDILPGGTKSGVRRKESTSTQERLTVVYMLSIGQIIR